MTQYEVIASPDELAGAAGTLSGGTGPFAVDVERASGYRYSARAYLIQVYRRDAGVFLFDPPAIGDFTALQRVMSSEEWVFHAASQDIPSLTELGLSAPSLFDTELAARLLGYERVGLGAVVESTLGVTLEKAHSAADWSTRPLPQDWLEYAALDVTYLVDVRDALNEELREKDKIRFASEEFEATRTKKPKAVAAEPWRRLSGLHTVRGARNVGIARELWLTRDALAQELDVAPGRLVPDRSLVAAVLAQPKTRSELSRVKEFNGRASRSHLDLWWAAIVRGRESQDLPQLRVPSDALPPVRAWSEKNPEADLRLKAAKVAVEARAEQWGMPIENLLTPEHLRRAAWEPRGESDEDLAIQLAELGARPWQIEQTAQIISDAFVQSVQDAAEATPDAS